MPSNTVINDLIEIEPWRNDSGLPVRVISNVKHRYQWALDLGYTIIGEYEGKTVIEVDPNNNPRYFISE